jgi:glutamate carboxypeptidase
MDDQAPRGAWGGSVTRHDDEEFGATIVGTFDAAAVGPTILMIGHVDTVFEPGTVAARPYRVEAGRAFGPGVGDMKSGLLVGLYALTALRSLSEGNGREWLPAGRIIFIANPDEEIGSPTSTPVIRRLASDADAALVLEGARPNGDIVSARKGMMHLRLTLRGRAAHAGVEPEKGRSAILEAAHKTIALHALSDRWEDVTVNVGVVAGGTRPNIVADDTVLAIDVRGSERAHLEAAEAAIRDVASVSTVPDVTTSVEISTRWWPMQKLGSSARLVDLAIGLGADLGFALKDAATGGASDANATAGLGIPTLDGLGPIAGGAHASNEYVELDSIAPRTTLVAALLLAIGRDEWSRSA